MAIQKGKKVRVRAYGGEIQVRRLLEARGQMAIISTDEECEAAAKEGREPICIGVPMADVLDLEKEESLALI